MAKQCAMPVVPHLKNLLRSQGSWTPLAEFAELNSGWVWSFIRAEHDGNIIEDAYTYDVLGLQTAVAGETGTTTWNGNTQLSATSTAGFTDSFTLTHTTVLDFYVDDYNWGVGDDTGGVSINIQAVPEASTAAMWLAGLVVMGQLGRRRRPA